MRWKINDHLNIYWPEYIGAIATLIIFFGFKYFELKFTNDSLKEITSLSTQVLAGYLGFLITAFAIIISLNIKKVIISRINSTVDPSLRDDLVNSITSTLDLLFKEIFFSLKIIAISTFFSFIIHVISNTESHLLISEQWMCLNSAISAIVIGTIVTNSINIIAIFQTAIELANIDDSD